MSRVKHSIALCPWQCSDPVPEHLVQGGFDCPTCCGRGNFYNELEEFTYPCKRCRGTGKLRAEIIINWKPDDSTITS